MTEQYVYGLHAVQALLGSAHRTAKKIYVNQERVDQRLERILNLAKQRNIAVEKLSQQKMNQRFAEFSHQGVVALAEPAVNYGEADLPLLLQKAKKPCLILILDGVTDPHNLGACLRTADATAVDFVIIPKDRSVGITPVVSKVACGAAESIPLVRVTNLVRAMEIIKQEGVWIYGAAGEATQNLYQIDCKGSLALVMGAEGEGLRRLTREHCDGLFALPMLGTVESLNVSVATGICLYEVLRQRA
ncbi:23S rRNA (guanosine(2251)-2'-O)-methyltransferase RlmB [Legionella jordanis]|uniref:23S rRNA (guanosine-2'-O-)-methyltransferase RlmB n=1 Tax=Legionella jordanis TaxID=456 RepID=A0A0W0VCZ2_9GAMM|nr:23S rRNA (guanosine(2251)-2'-O)-methyltransferase RlmB [Legionella jordanis]KTD18004.1 tRNA/rRNA methyltransferase [Legionella jordanis]RMX02307.1 23S rRNA (guanosine(2251)-2'-O)-methyltransferase RlmB [Legionella jordanis]RMX21208.1 23S rRNA (guanosine(2251)-2'-O)-methyltransferase RlmB [Legionella jordanis]VEH13904.1 tRNA/rRNA methyltransferase [Legionella jordanis]HAT8714285.1 23S rRNA (guanosine(2251)-2'-O)-methyltransferase RlmB [Legionella jordanis]